PVATSGRTVAPFGARPASLSRLRPSGRIVAPRSRRGVTLETLRKTDGRPQEEDLQGQGPQPPRRRVAPPGGPPRSVCPRCNAVKLPHVVCGNCGWYGGRVAVEVDLGPFPARRRRRAPRRPHAPR